MRDKWIASSSTYPPFVRVILSGLSTIGWCVAGERSMFSPKVITLTLFPQKTCPLRSPVERSRMVPRTIKYAIG